MKKTLAILTATTSLCLSLQAAPVLRFEFSESGTSQASTGTAPLSLTTYQSASAPDNYVTSVTPGAPSVGTGMALNFTSQNLEGAKATASGTLSADPAYAALTSSLGSFTVTAWVSDLNAKIDRRRLFFLSGGTTRAIDIFFSTGTNGNVMSLAVAGSGTENPERIVTSAPSVFVPNGNNEWYFVAVTYDATSGATSFYAGAQDDLLKTSSSTLLNSSGQVYTMPTNSTTVNVGNSSVGASGVFDGYLSDVRFYGEVLDAQSIEALHAVPEPSTAAILGLGLGVAAVCKFALNKGKN